jgi:sugar/nucleoside kinase (ribokinase family)
LGGRAAYIGRVRDDQLGAVFRHDLTSQGVTFTTKAAREGAATARCLVLVTPDAQRSMQTYLGACVELSEDDIDEGIIAGAQVTYLEGYLWDPPAAKIAMRKAAQIARDAGRKVSLSLSDPFCVGRHRAEFLQLVAEHIDILFANEAEITALFECDFDQAIRNIRDHVEIAAITRDARGSLVVCGNEVVSVAAVPVDRLVDTTGAGDLYAAGFLHGVTTGRTPAECARLGGICAAEVISHMGARPEKNLARLIADAALLPV